MTEGARGRVIIAGAGLAGALLASLLGRRGYRVDVYERRADPRTKGFIGGRSINLALSARGIDALRRIGLADRVLADTIPMPGRMMHAEDGTLTYQPYSKDPNEAIRSVSRGGLNLMLLEAAAALPSVTLHFEHRCEGLDLDTARAEFIGPDGAIVAADADVVIGADGAFSAVRGHLQRTDRFSYSQTYLDHGYKELTIPPTADGDFAMEPHALHIWPRGGYMMIALPNPDRSFTCTCFWPFSGPFGFASFRTPEEIRGHFERHFGDAVPLMPDLVTDFQNNPTSSLVTVRCRPWHHDGGVLVLGDAAHAIVPFYGQGMNAAFEDCVVLDGCLDRTGDDWSKALPEMSRVRIDDANAIADMALDNFIEMRDKVGSRRFLLKKRTEQLLHRWFPRRFMPLYNMVSFSTIPYAAARARAARQARGLRNAALFLVGVVLLAGGAALVHWLR